MEPPAPTRSAQLPASRQVPRRRLNPTAATLLVAALALVLTGCASTGGGDEGPDLVSSAVQDGKGLPHGVGDGAPVTTQVAPSGGYGDHPAHPIRVGGGMFGEGSRNQRCYLAGPAGSSPSSSSGSSGTAAGRSTA